MSKRHKVYPIIKVIVIVSIVITAYLVGLSRFIGTDFIWLYIILLLLASLIFFAFFCVYRFKKVKSGMTYGVFYVSIMGVFLMIKFTLDNFEVNLLMAMAAVVISLGWIFFMIWKTIVELEEPNPTNASTPPQSGK